MFKYIRQQGLKPQGNMKKSLQNMRLGLLVGLLRLGAGAVPDALPGSWEPIPHPGLPCAVLIQEEVLSLTTT